MEKYYDILIVGSGPAGCTFLKFLEKNYSVLMVDKNKTPTNKICGGLLTGESVAFLNKFNYKIPDYIFSRPKKLNKIYVDLHRNKRRENGYVYNICRKKFNEWLFNLIKDKADIIDKTNFININLTKNPKIGYDVSLFDFRERKPARVRCKYVVGADGVYSKVRRELPAPMVTKYFAIQEYCFLPNSLDELFFFFSKELVDHFIWLIPKGDTLIIGMPFRIGIDNKNIFNKFEKAKQVVMESFGENFDFKSRKAYKVSIPMDEKELYLGKNKIFLIGEAAGWISSRSGDGISFALRSGYNLANSFNVAENDVDIMSLYAKNSENLRKEFEQKLHLFKNRLKHEKRQKKAIIT